MNKLDCLVKTIWPCLDFGLNSPLLAVDCSFDVMVAVSIRGFLRIDAHGFGLGYSTKSISTMFSRLFGDHWAHLFLQHLQKRVKASGESSDCKYKRVREGRRARSLGYFEDFNAPDVGCIYN